MDQGDTELNTTIADQENEFQLRQQQVDTNIQEININKEEIKTQTKVKNPLILNIDEDPQLSYFYNPYLDNKSEVFTHMSQILSDYDSKVQEFEEIYKEYSSQQIKFMDIDFPHSTSSITAQTKPKLYELSKLLKWNSVTVMHKEYSIIPQKIHPGQVKQGRLGDCYLLGVFSALAAQNYLVTRLFYIQSQNDPGIYGIWLNDSGEWKMIILDDYFPYGIKTQTLSFIRYVDNTIWPMLLEKAYAKLFQNYGEISAGWARNAMRDLTGATVDQYTCVQPEQFWPILKKALQNGYIITAFKSSELKHDPDPFCEGNKIVKNHVYTILDAKSIKMEQGLSILIKLRNPWGLNTISSQENFEKEVWQNNINNTDSNINDKGVIWLSIDGFCKQFNIIDIGKVHPNYKYSSVKILHEKEETLNKFSVVKITVLEQTHGYLKLMQVTRRTARKIIQKYMYSHVRLFLVQITSNNQLIWNTGLYMADPSMEIELELLPGQYYAIIEPDWLYEQIQTLVLAWYGKEHVILENKNISKEELIYYQRESFENYVLKKHQESIESTGLAQGTDYGLKYYFYKNITNQQICHKVILDQTDIYHIYPHHDIIDFIDKDIHLAPGDQQLFMYHFKKKQPQPKNNIPDNIQDQNDKLKEMPIDNLEETIKIIKEDGNQFQKEENNQKIDVFYHVCRFLNNVGIVFENQLNDIITLNIVLTLTNLEIIQPQANGQKLELQIQPKSNQLVILKKIDESQPYDYYISEW